MKKTPQTNPLIMARLGLVERFPDAPDGSANSGHRQLSIGFSNEVALTPGHRFSKRHDPESEQLTVPISYLVARVHHRHSFKFRAFLRSAQQNAEKVKAAQEELTAAETEVESIRQKCRDHFASVPGFSEVVGRLRPLQQSISTFKRELENKRLRPRDRRARQMALDTLIAQAEPLEAEERRLMHAHSEQTPVTPQEQRDADQRVVRAAANLKLANKLVRKDDFTHSTLMDYLVEHAGVPVLGEEDWLVNGILKEGLELYELEKNPRCDERGVPMAAGGNGELERCQDELAVPWNHIQSVLEDPEALNRINYFADRRYFVYCAINREKPAGTDSALNVDRIVVGERGSNGHPSRALILRPNEWKKFTWSVDHFLTLRTNRPMAEEIKYRVMGAAQVKGMDLGEDGLPFVVELIEDVLKNMPDLLAQFRMLYPHQSHPLLLPPSPKLLTEGSPPENTATEAGESGNSSGAGGARPGQASSGSPEDSEGAPPAVGDEAAQVSSLN